MGTNFEGRVRTDIAENTGIKVFAIVQNPKDNDELSLVQIRPGDKPVNADAVIFEKDGAPIGAIRVSNATTVTATMDDNGNIHADSWEPSAQLLFNTKPEIYRNMMSISEFIDHDSFLSQPVLDRYYSGLPLQSSILHELHEIGELLNASNITYMGDVDEMTIASQAVPQSMDLQQEKSQHSIG